MDQNQGESVPVETNVDLPTECSKSYQDLVGDIARMRKQNADTLQELSDLKLAIVELVDEKSKFKEVMLSAFTATMNEQKLKYREVIAENEQLIKENNELRAKIAADGHVMLLNKPNGK